MSNPPRSLDFVGYPLRHSCATGRAFRNSIHWGHACGRFDRVRADPTADRQCCRNGGSGSSGQSAHSLTVLLAPFPRADGQERHVEQRPRPPGEVLPPPIILPRPLPARAGSPEARRATPGASTPALPRVPPSEGPQEPVTPTQEAPTAPPPTVPAEVPPAPPSLPVLPPELLRREEITAESPVRPIPLGLAPPFEAPRGYGLHRLGEQPMKVW